MPKHITMQQFQAVFLRVANQMFARCFYTLNWPIKPQLLGIQTSPDIDPESNLAAELIEIGFEFRWGKIWAIERDEEAQP